MTHHPHDELGARLRRALHAEVDSIVPPGDGLERIRAGVEKRRLRRAFLATWWLKPALAAFGAITVAGSATVAAPLLQEVGDRGLGGPSASAPISGSAPEAGQVPPVAASPTPSPADPGGTPSQQPTVTPTPAASPSTAVECYPNETARQDGKPKAKDAQPPANATQPPSGTTPSPSASPSVGPTCAPGSSPTATVTPTESPTSECPDAADECPSPSATNKSPSPSPAE